MSDPLSYTFDLPTTENLEEIEKFIEISIPEDANLCDIVKLNLEAYRAQVEALNQLEPRFRARGMEVAHAYLQSAMEAIAKDRELKMRKEKLDHDLNKKEGGKKMLLEDGVSREELLREITTENRKH